VPNASLTVALRDGSGKGAARKLRAAGHIPGVCYGRKIDSIAIQIDPKALEHLLAKSGAGMNTLIDLNVEGGGEFDGRTVLVKDLQREPIYGVPLHADLYAVDLTQTIIVQVPVRLTGIAHGVRVGFGILDHSLREIELECLPTAIPSEIVVDVSDVELNQSLHVRDIALPEGVELRTDSDLSVVSVVTPAAAEEEAVAEPVEGEEGAEPAEGEAAAADSGESSESKSGETPAGD
jgi:large subunit ribosomal protein L25